MIRLSISGMTCSGCARSIVTAIHDLDSQARVEADLAGREVSVDTPVHPGLLVKAIREAGYDAQLA